MTEKIELVIPAADLAEAKQDLREAGVSFDDASARGMDGANVVSLLVDLGGSGITGLTAYFIARERAKRYVQLKYKGIELTGVSGATITKILQQIAALKGEHER